MIPVDHVAIIMDGNGRWALQKGKLEKFKQENTLINQIWIMDPKKK